MAKELTKSTSNLNDVLYGGRPKNEEPHVKRTTKKKSEKIEYIVRVDLDELKINDNEFEDLQSLFVLFDLDKDGILNFKEYEKLAQNFSTWSLVFSQRHCSVDLRRKET